MDMIFVYIVAGSQFFCNLSAFTIGKRWAKEGINSMNTIGDVRKLPTDHQYDENDSSVKLRQMLHAKNFDEYLTQYSNGKWEGNLGTLEHLYLGQKRPGESSQRSKIFNGNEQLYLSTEKNMQVPEHRNTDIIRNFPYNLAPHHEEKQFLTVLENKVDISTSSKDNRYVLSNLGVLNSVSEDNSVRNYPTEKGNGGAMKEVSHRSKRGLRRYYKILKGLLGAGAQLATSLTPQEYSTLAGEGLKFLGHKGGDWTKRLVHSVGNGAKTYLSNAGLEGVDFVSGGVKALGTFSGKAITTTSNIVGEAIKHVGSAFNKSYQTGKSLFNIVG